jgi:hypothetical protein
MDTPHTHTAAAAAPGAASPGILDELLDGEWRYCPTRLLARFALLMAGHGRCVSTDMMLGDREYAMWQIACARATEDDELDAVAQKLLAYFDDAQHTAAPVLGTA